MAKPVKKYAQGGEPKPLITVAGQNRRRKRRENRRNERARKAYHRKTSRREIGPGQEGRITSRQQNVPTVRSIASGLSQKIKENTAERLKERKAKEQEKLESMSTKRLNRYMARKESKGQDINPNEVQPKLSRALDRLASNIERNKWDQLYRARERERKLDRREGVQLWRDKEAGERGAFIRNPFYNNINRARARSADRRQHHLEQRHGMYTPTF
jgi:hypothetical protein